MYITRYRYRYPVRATSTVLRNVRLQKIYDIYMIYDRIQTYGTSIGCFIHKTQKAIRFF